MLELSGLLGTRPRTLRWRHVVPNEGDVAGAGVLQEVPGVALGSGVVLTAVEAVGGDLRVHFCRGVTACPCCSAGWPAAGRRSAGSAARCCPSAAPRWAGWRPRPLRRPLRSRSPPPPPSGPGLKASISWMALTSCSAARCPARSSKGSTSHDWPMICGGATLCGGGAGSHCFPRPRPRIVAPSAYCLVSAAEMPDSRSRLPRLRGCAARRSRPCAALVRGPRPRSRCCCQIKAALPQHLPGQCGKGWPR